MIEFDIEGYMKELKGDMGKNIEKACIHLAKRIKQKLSSGSPGERHVTKSGVYYTRKDEPSEPGQPPKLLTGQLRQSIAYEVDKPALTGVVGTNLKYGAYLELGTSKMAARPYLRSTLMEEEKKLGDILSGQ